MSKFGSRTILEKCAPIGLIDVGASGGMEKEWRSLLPYVSVVGFEPDKNEYNIEAPKTISRLEEISDVRHAARKAEEEEDDDEENDKIVISTENIKLNDLDVYTLGVPNVKLEPLKLNDIEVLT